ncbi:MAG: sigma 54-interacting transcriptional regulator [Candidatus Brocadiales bacterium]
MGTTSARLEGELFGHASGFFRSLFSEGEGHKGKLELAGGGTLLLDEVGDIPLSIQSKILRVLLTGEFERGGDTKVRKIDVRIIATTSRSLDRAVAEGTFDKDLYFRLNTIPIELLPLQESKANIPLWAGFFLENIRNRINSPGLRLSEEALQSLMEYHWPGNLVELESCLERAAIVAKGELISNECLSIPLSSGQREKKTSAEDGLY